MTLSDKIRALCGYIEDGSGATVKIFQDDATRTWHIYVGSTHFYDTSFKAVIERAYDCLPDDPT